MPHDLTMRFEIKLQPACRRRLDELASATGISATDLTRLAIGQLLEQRVVRLPTITQQEQAA
jgi:predicted transcriptional regulator